MLCERLLSLMFRFSSDSKYSIPASECSRFDLSFSVLMAGNGLRESECKEAIMQFDRSRELSLVRDVRLSGTSVKRLNERLSERSDAVKGRMFLASRLVRALSASDKYLKRCQFEAGGRVTFEMSEDFPRRREKQA